MVFTIHGKHSHFVQFMEKFSLLYEPSIVNPLCRDAAYDSCEPLSDVPHADQHPPGEPASGTQLSYPVGCYQKSCFLAIGTNHFRRMSLIV